ncbi:MAG: hypothetical protein ACOZCO_17320 [Bacteroidota bacterium]
MKKSVVLLSALTLLIFFSCGQPEKKQEDKKEETPKSETKDEMPAEEIPAPVPEESSGYEEGIGTGSNKNSGSGSGVGTGSGNGSGVIKKENNITVNEEGLD